MTQDNDCVRDSHNYVSQSKQMLTCPMLAIVGIQDSKGTRKPRPITNFNFHLLVNDVCRGRSIDPCYGEIEDWDVSQVSYMSEAFKNQTDFNRDISRWDTSNVITMRSMFERAEATK